MNFAALFKAYDTVMALRQVAKRFKGEPAAPPETGMSPQTAAQGIAGQIEARLSNVLVAALKEAFDRDHARLELERAQLDEQRRRAEETLRMELRRQTAERELGRLRLIAGTAMVGWIASVLVLGARLSDASSPARAALALGWVLLLAALGAAFSAQGRLGTFTPDSASPVDAGRGGAASVWLLIAGLAVTASSLLL